MAAVAVFTVELIVDTLRGPACTGVQQLTVGGVSALANPESPLRPLIGVRVLSLPPAIVEAPESESYGAAKASQVKFGGRGKAMVFELPEDCLATTDSKVVSPRSRRRPHQQCTEPLPLWLMALARPRTEVEVHGASGTAVLLASACVDLRSEASRAHAHATATWCPFRRCEFKMSSVRDVECDLTLDCYFRLYAGQQRALSGGELMLEPAAVAPLHAHFVGPSHARSRECVAAETQTEEVDPTLEELPTGQALDALLGRPRSPSRCRQTAMASPSLATTPLQGSRDPPRPGTPAGKSAPPLSAATPLPRTTVKHAPSAFFPEEIVLRPVCGAAAIGKGNCAPDLAANRTASPEVASSLPLVSELLRELWEIRKVE